MSGPLATANPWNLVAGGYAECAAPVTELFSNRAIELLCLAEESHVLDVACGPGTTAGLLCQAGHRVEAVDFSAAMIGELEAKMKPGQPLAEANVRAQIMDGQDLRFADQSVDAALSMFGLMFFPDRARGFSELHRVLKPGGRACVSSWLPLSDVPAMQWMFGAVMAIMPASPGQEPPAPSLEDPALFAAEMEQAGFRSVHVERCSQTIPMPDLTDFWDTMVKSSAPITLLRSEVGEEKWTELNKEAFEHLRQTRPENLESFTMEAWLGLGEKAS